MIPHADALRPACRLADYRDTVLARFANPAVKDQLLRITSDGASKIPVFIGETLGACLSSGGDHRRLAFLFAAFGHYLLGRDDRGNAFTAVEPHLAPADLALAADADPAAVLRVANFKGLGLAQADGFAAQVRDYRGRIAAEGALATLAAMQAEGG